MFKHFRKYTSLCYKENMLNIKMKPAEGLAYCKELKQLAWLLQTQANLSTQYV